MEDIPEIVAIAKKHRMKTILDLTWAIPLFLKVHSYGIDNSVEAGTKYVGGHSEILLGFASANSDSWPALRVLTYVWVCFLVQRIVSYP